MSRLTAPGADPSTAGARWKFREKEFFRSLGLSPATKRAFHRIKTECEKSSDADLKLRLAELNALRSRGTADKQQYNLWGAEIHLINGELGARKSDRYNVESAESRRQKSWMADIRRRAFIAFAHDAGREETERRLRSAYQQCSGLTIPPDADCDLLIRGLMEWTFPEKEGKDS